jgi:hypothetical protein
MASVTYVWEGVGLLVFLLVAAVLWAWRRFRRVLRNAPGRTCVIKHLRKAVDTWL